MDAVIRPFDLVVCLASPPTGGRETVADLDTLDRLDAHQGAGEAGVESAVPVHVRTETRRQAVNYYFDNTTKSVAVLLRGIDLLDHPGARRGVRAPDRVLVDASKVVVRRHQTVRRLNRPDGDDMTEDRHTSRLMKQLASDRAESHPRRGLPRARSLEHWSRVVERVLLHPDEISVPRAWPGERSVAGEVRQ